MKAFFPKNAAKTHGGENRGTAKGGGPDPSKKTAAAGGTKTPGNANGGGNSHQAGPSKNKSNGYWKCGRQGDRPPWTDGLGVTWAPNDSVCKLLAVPFGLSLSTDNVNDFLHKKLTDKLTHWSNAKVNRPGRGVVANGILLSSLFFFFSVWGGTKKGVAKLKSSILKYLAAGKLGRSRARVSWIQCCQSKQDSGIGLINPEDAVAALIGKWVIKALEPSNSNLYLLLRLKLSQAQPYSGGRWHESLEYMFIAKHQARCGLIVWNRVTPAWKSLLHSVSFVQPTCWDDLMCMSWW